MTHRSSERVWLPIGATLFFTLMYICVKLVAETASIGQIVFYRSAVALIPLIIFLYVTGDFPKGLAIRRPMGHFLRCLFGCAAMFTSFAAFSYLPLAEATLLGYLAPVVTLLLAKWLLAEHITALRWKSVIIGFVGVIVLIVPDISELETLSPMVLWGSIFGVLAAVLTACAKIQIRVLTQTESAASIAFYFAVVCALAGGATSLFGWPSLGKQDLLWLIGTGLAGGVAHIMMTYAYKCCEASHLAGLDYLSLLFAIVADILIFNIFPNISFIFGSLLIIAGSLCVTLPDLFIRKSRT